MKEIDNKNEIKLVFPKKEREFLREGEQLVVRNIKGDTITLVRSKKSGVLEQFRGIWGNEDVDKVFKKISRQWKAWRKYK
ncbi:MAG: hypothetical protein WCT39_02035 [Candidatus Margulisiibacteriota bacterium]